MTKILMKTSIPQLKKTKKKASHPLSIGKQDIDSRHFVDQLEQAGISIKLSETKILRKQYVLLIQTALLHINNKQVSENEQAEKITQIAIIYDRNPDFKEKRCRKSEVVYIYDTDKSLSNVDKNTKEINPTTNA